MKIQDILFLLILAFLIYKKDSRLSLVFGLGALILSIPLFFLQIFFTAQHLVYYAFFFIFLSIVYNLIKYENTKSNPN